MTGVQSESHTYLSHVRAGGRDQYTHCYTCGLCLPRDKAHKCIQDTSHNNCPVCMEVS